MNEEGNILRTNKSIFRMTEEGIIEQELPVSVDITLDDSKEDLAVYKVFCKEKKRPLMVDIRNIRTIQRESRLLYSSDEAARYISATALLVGNPVSRIMANFFLGINRAKHPVKLFTSKKQATVWLRGYL